MKSVSNVIVLVAWAILVAACGGDGGNASSVSTVPPPAPLPPPSSGTALVFEGEFGSNGTELGEFNRPRAVTVDSQGRIIITDRENGRIQLCDYQGVICTAFGSVGFGVGDFMLPQGITVDSLDRIIVSDFGNSRVQICNDVGLCSAFGSEGSALGQFGGVQGIDVDSQDRIFVADSPNDRIQICDHQGVCTAFDISKAAGLEVDSQDRIIVSDSNNHRIYICDDQGNCTSFGSQGSAPGQFEGPRGVAVDNAGRIYIADTFNHRIQICDYQGSCLVYGNRGNGPGQFDTPSGITVDNQGRIIVADTFNHRLQIFSLGTETPSVTVVAASSTYPAGTSACSTCSLFTSESGSDTFTSMTDDPLGPFSGQSVHFRGVRQGGVSLVYRYRLDFAQEVTLDSIIVEGAAWLDDTISLLDEQGNVMATIVAAAPGGSNSFHRQILDASGITGRTFFLEEFNEDWIWRYRSNIVVNFSGGIIGD